MRRLAPLAATAAMIVLAGCGAGASHTRLRPPPAATPASTPFACHPRQPPQLGECIRQELEHDSRHKLQPPKPSLTLSRAIHAQGIDISRWQLHPAFQQLHREGIRFVIVQAADNAHASNPFFASQVREAHEAGMQVGVYIFAEGDSSVAQADALITVAATERSRITLGAYVDAEIPAAYPQACGIEHVLQAHFWIVGVYGSPGTYQGGACGFSWPAEWSFGLASPLPGFSFSSIKLRQWCGTCRLAGNDGEIDRDEDLGALALSQAKPKPTPAQKRVELAALDRLLGAYNRRSNPHGHDCANPPYHHPYPSARYDHPCATWASQARALR